MNDQTYEVNRLLRDAESAEEVYLLYARRAEEARVSSAIDGERTVDVTVARGPEPPLQPAGPPTSLLLAATLLLASVGGVGAAFTLEMLDRSLTTGDDLERLLGIRHLASVPESPVAVRAAAGAVQDVEAEAAETHAGSRWTFSMRNWIREASWVRSLTGGKPSAVRAYLANQLTKRRSRAAYQRVAHELMSLPGTDAKVVLVAGAVEGEGASTVAGQVAVALARSRQGRVLLVDVEGGGDPSGSNASRLVEVTAEDGDGEGGHVEPVAEGVSPLPYHGEVGTPFPLVTGSELTKALTELSRRFDWMVIDGRPLTQYPETAALSAQADATLLVLRAESTRAEVARRAVDIVQQSGGDLVGGVLNRRRYHIPQSVYARL